LSYVIQNFYEYSKRLILTPRFKFLLFFNNIEKFLIFIKFNTFLYYTDKINLLNFNYFFLFFKYIFSEQYIKTIYKLNLLFVGNYTSNLTKSAIYGIFKVIDKFLKNNALTATINLIEDELQFNQYFFSIKTLNTKLSKQFYRNVFFFKMITTSFI